MRLSANETIARLAAADPARDLRPGDAARAQLWERIAVSPRAAVAGGRPRARLRALMLVVPLLFVLAAGALAAGGVIRFGAPAKTIGGPYNPRSGLGVLIPGTVQLLGIVTPDPAGGPPWGMRVLATTRGEGCIQVGRLLEGKLGALGQDGAFGNDGRFHELSANSAFDALGCTALDGNGRLFLNVTIGDRPASAWVGYGGRSGGCVPATSSPAEKDLEPTPVERRLGVKVARTRICPQGDERDLYYGLLGPEAQSITYVLDGHRHTQATVGPEGAYLIVTRAAVHQLFDFANGGTTDVVPVDGPITELHYRNGATCHLTARSWIGGSDSCTPVLKEPVGWMAPKSPVLTAAQVATPLRVQLIHSHRLLHTREARYVIVLSFKSRVAIANSRRDYEVTWHQPGMPPQVHGFEFTDYDVSAGQTIVKRIGDLGPALRPGVTSGTVTLQQATGARGTEGPGSREVPIGRFAVRVP